MNMTSQTIPTSPLAPWNSTWGSIPIGTLALLLVAVFLVAVTLWTYLGHPQASRKRVTIILILRLIALLIALLTAIRPSVRVEEEPKPDPSVLLIGVDFSQSMTVKDELKQARIDAVKRKLEECRPLLEELERDRAVETIIYKFATPTAGPYDPNAVADGKTSDYGAYLKRSLDEPRAKRVRGHLVIGDGADNANPSTAIEQARRWGKRGLPLTTITVGSDATGGDTRDIIVRGISFEQGGAPVPSVPIKTEFTVVATVDAFNFERSPVKARVYFDDKQESQESVILEKREGNKVRITVHAPPTPGQIRIRLRVGREEEGKAELQALPNEKSDRNNEAEAYLPVTKDGVRVLIIDRLRWEETLIRDALRPEEVLAEGAPKKGAPKTTRRGRFDLYEVIRQSDTSPTSDEIQWLDLDKQGYDVVIIGNVSYPQLEGVLLPDGKTLPQKITERVVEKGMGLMFLGGEEAYKNYPPPPAGDPLTRQLVFTDLLPVDVQSGTIVEGKLYQFVPTARGFDDRVLRIGKDTAETEAMWNKLNGSNNRSLSRITGYNKFTPRIGLPTVYAWATPDAPNAVPAGDPKTAGDPLLVGQQIGAGSRGRVLALAAYDTYMWERLGQPKTREGVDIHDRFWRQCVLWLAHQEEEEGQLYVRPELLTPPTGRDMAIRVGLKAPGGGDEPNATLWVKILSPGEFNREVLTGKSVEAVLATPGSPQARELAAALAKAQLRTVTADKDGSKVMFRPTVPGEYLVVATSPHKGPNGQPLIGTDSQVWGDLARLKQVYVGEGRFIAQQDLSDEMLAIAARPDIMEKLAAESRGQSLKLQSLPDYLRGLKKDLAEKKVEYRPDWRRAHSRWFLPLWLILFATVLCAEWGLRRLWGMV